METILLRLTDCLLSYTFHTQNSGHPTNLNKLNSVTPINPDGGWVAQWYRKFSRRKARVQTLDAAVVTHY